MMLFTPVFSPVVIDAAVGGNDANTTVFFPFTVDSLDKGTGGTSNPNTITLNDGAALNSAVADPWGGSLNSLLLDGSNDDATFNDSVDFDFGTGSFTCDMFVRPDTLSGQIYSGFVTNSGGNRGFWISLNGSGTLGIQIDQNTNSFTSVGSVSSGVWTHIAYERDGSTNRIYIDGTVDAATLTKANSVSSTGWALGHLPQTQSSNFAGRISNFRLSNIARYEGSNFTPPTGPYD